MGSKVTLLPSVAVERVAHDEQLTIWANDLIGTLGVHDFLSTELTGGDIGDLHAVLKREIKGIVGSAFDHPEAQTVATTHQEE